jgi:hypothetical protein
MLKNISLLSLLLILLAAPSWAGQRICASPPETSHTSLFLPERSTITILVKGEPKARFLLRYEWACRKGHTYREAGPEGIKIVLPSCSQSGKALVTVRQGCAVFEVQTNTPTSRRR